MPSEKEIDKMQSELKPCPWCYGKNGKTDLDFTIIDDDFGQPVHPKLIKFCPFCGRSLQKGVTANAEN